MRQPNLRLGLFFSVICTFLLTACGGSEVEINVLVNAGAADYVSAAAVEYNLNGDRSDAGNKVVVRVTPLEAGEAVVDLAGGVTSAELWIPDDQVWANIAADQGNSNYQLDCTSIARSPLVIGMWREVAGLFGWPGRELGWLDVGSIAADQTAWQYYSGGQYGDIMRLGHTHPGLSGSGASTLLALVHSAELKPSAVTLNDISQPIVQASVGAFEGGVSWFSKDTETLGTTMYERGAEFLGAGVMYENTVLAEGRGEIVPIYPFEGTFMATHPACINSAANSAQQSAARAFRDWMLSDLGQSLAVAYGLRPVSDSTDTQLLTSYDGVDLSQPATEFASPSVETVYAVQELWQSARKPIHLVMLLDTSGSMRGGKIESMLAAAVQFVEQMGDGDYLTLIEFYTSADVLSRKALIKDNRGQLIQTISNMEASGDTSLYDAIGTGGELIAELNSLDTANAMVVLGDGQDTSSRFYSLGQPLVDLAAANSTTVFTIAYGRDADEYVLQGIANAANGQYFQGDEASIGAIYDEMSAAFGGSVGIGR